MSRNIVVTSGKGGVGKSSVAAYLGVALCRLKNKVLLIDMDEGLRSLDLILGVSSSTVFDVTDVLSNRCDVEKAIAKVGGVDGLYLLAAPAGKGEIQDKFALKKLCDLLFDKFDFIIIDCPAGIGDGFYYSMNAADEALLVVNPDPVSVRDGGIVSKLLRQNGIDNVRLVINKIDTHLMIKGSFKNIDEAIDETEVQLIACIPTDYEIVVCEANGKLLGHCYAYDAFERLAQRIVGRNVLLPNLRKFT